MSAAAVFKGITQCPDIQTVSPVQPVPPGPTLTLGDSAMLVPTFTAGSVSFI